MTRIQYRDHDVIIDPIGAHGNNVQSMSIRTGDREVEWHYIQDTVAKAAYKAIQQIDARVNSDTTDVHIQHEKHIADVMFNKPSGEIVIQICTKKKDNPEQIWTDDTHIASAVASAINHIDRFRAAKLTISNPKL